MFNFQIICKIANTSNSFQISNFVIQILQIIKTIQIISLLLPSQGWNVWTYEDPYLNIIHYIAQGFVGIPLIIDLKIFSYFLSLIFIITLLFIFISIRFVQQQGNPFQMVQFVMLLFTNIMQIPILSLFLSQIICGQNSLVISCDFSSQRIINAFAIVFYSLLVFVTQYFCRTYSFQPYNKLQLRYTVIQPLNYILLTVIISLSFATSNNYINYLQLTILNCYILLLIIEAKFYKPSIPEINIFKFKLSCLLEILCMIVTFAIFTEELNQHQILLTMLIFGSIIYYLSNQIFDNIHDNNYINLCQYIYSQQPSKTKFTDPKQWLTYLQLIKHHQNQCTFTCKKKTTQINIARQGQQIIYCILLNQLKNINIQLEELELFYISFLSTICKKPLLGYVQLKRYDQLHLEQQSHYYKQMKNQINQSIEYLIIQQQKRQKFEIRIFVDNCYEQLKITEIIKCFQLQDKFIPQYQELINLKINLYTQQIKGFNFLSQLETLIIQISNKIHNIKQQLESSLNITNDKFKKLKNALQLRLISIYFSAIRNDVISTQLCEKQISEIFEIERTVDTNLITNIKLFEEKVAYLQLSLVKKRGQLFNKKDFSSFFGYSPEAYAEIECINQLMPQFISAIHDSFLQEFIQSNSSQLLIDYVPIYTITEQGFIKSMQLQISNYFNLSDDFIISGCLSTINESYDYVLFGEDGQILGVSKEFYEIFIKQVNQHFLNIEKLYIFMFIPEIIEIIKRYLLSEAMNNTALIQIYEQAQVYQVQELDKYVAKFRQLDSFYQRESMHFQSQYDTEKGLLSYLGHDSSYSIQRSSTKQIYNRKITDESYQDMIKELWKQFDTSVFDKYVIKYNISSQIIGKKTANKKFYILSIYDIKKRDSYTFGDSMPFTSSVQVHKNQFFQNGNESQVTTEIFEETKLQEIFVHQSVILPVPKNMVEFIPDSGRDSYSYGPTSQRAQFISPSSKQLQLEEIIDIESYQDQNFNDLENSSSQKPKKSSSNNQDRQDENKDIYEILKLNKTQYQKDDNKKYEIDLKSKSSNTSGTSGQTAIHVAKNFQQQTQFTKSLRLLVFINTLTALILISYLVIELIINDQVDASIRQKLVQLTGPMRLNQYYCKILSFGWGLLFNSLGLIDSSEFLLDSYLRHLIETNAEVFLEFQDMYPIYIDLENQLLIEHIPLDLIYQNGETVSYSYFQDFIQASIARILFAKDYSIDELSKIVNKEFIDNLMLLNLNLKNIIVLSVELISTLQILFLEYLDKIISDNAIVITIQVLVLAIVFFSQIYFWRKNEVYVQRLLLIQSKLQENTAQQLIIRMNFIKESLMIQQGKQSWKQKNCFSSMYEDLTPIQQASIKQLKQTFGNDYKRKNVSTILISRIYNTEISIKSNIIFVFLTYFIFFAFFFGGFLLFDQQTLQIKPTQDLNLQFIRFTTEFDIVAISELIIKTEKLMFNKFLNDNIYTQEQYQAMQDPENSLIQNFITLESSYNQNLSYIYENIIGSSKIDNYHKDLLTQLYSQNLCLVLQDKLKFCNFNSDFASINGQYNQEDDNREYLKDGIVGIVSRFNVMTDQLFNYEITNKDFEPNLTLVLEQVKTQEFNNAIFRHFMDTTDATQYVLNIVSELTILIMDQDLSNIYIYYLLAGITIILLFIFIYSIWIYRCNKRLIGIRMGLSNLPIEIITEQHTLNQLKQLN